MPLLPLNMKSSVIAERCLPLLKAATPLPVTLQRESIYGFRCIMVVGEAEVALSAAGHRVRIWGIGIGMKEAGK